MYTYIVMYKMLGLSIYKGMDGCKYIYVSYRGGIYLSICR